MMKKLSVVALGLVACAALSGCSSVKRMSGADGRENVMVSSPTIAGAQQALSETCGPSGYTVLELFNDYNPITQTPMRVIVARCGPVVDPNQYHDLKGIAGAKQ